MDALARARRQARGRWQKRSFRSKGGPPHGARRRPAPRWIQLHGLVAEDLRAVNGVILDNMQSSVDAHFGARRTHYRGRRQAPQADADARFRPALRLHRQAAHRPCRLRRVHSHRDAAPRRCRRRQCAAAGHGDGERGLGQQAERAGRRLSIQPRVSTFPSRTARSVCSAFLPIPPRPSQRARSCSSPPPTTPRRARPPISM